MSGARKRFSLLQELERTEEVLEVLLSRLTNLHAALEPIERQMHVTDFSSNGVFVQGVSRGIACVLSGLIRGDPLEQLLQDKRGSGIPRLIKAGDRNESRPTIESIVKMVRAEDQKRPVEFIVNLRWAVLPEPIERDNIAIIGTRYRSGKPSELNRFKSKLKGLGLVILDDDGEFGGGPLVFEFIKSFKDKSEFLVFELTLSHKMSENEALVTGVLNVLTDY
ncbi:MAG: hypothetical protein ACFFEE_06210 [Candidatus Thorarchaeota archaeon]